MSHASDAFEAIKGLRTIESDELPLRMVQIEIMIRRLKDDFDQLVEAHQLLLASVAELPESKRRLSVFLFEVLRGLMLDLMMSKMYSLEWRILYNNKIKHKLKEPYTPEALEAELRAWRRTEQS